MSELGEAEVRQLFGGDTGTFLLTTASGSQYLLDLDERTIARFQAHAFDPDRSWPTALLRRDTEAIRLVQLLDCRVGASLLATIDLRRDGILTLRNTTPLLSIERIGADGDPENF